MTDNVQISDHDLLSAFRDGDDRAFETLYQRWQGRTLYYATRLLGSRAEAEEIVTDAFVTIVQGKVKTTGSFRSFLFTVVHRRCLDALRKRTTHKNVHHLLVPSPSIPDLDQSIDAQRSAERLENALDSLPPEHRSVLLLYYSQGLPSREVGSILNLSDQQVRSKLSYARRALKSILETS